ncbi:MerR family transcriptional regulator [Streptomyces sp. NBC_00490]|uniref:MerR family transcriptional regulator n=1 Tax=Streptomyces sp. NBC_00490 TaxID=2903657 RepID=UPI003FCC3D9D
MRPPQPPYRGSPVDHRNLRIEELFNYRATARALQRYEQAGLISSERAVNGYRVYDERALVRVRNIRYLLAAGLALADLGGTLTLVPHRPTGTTLEWTVPLLADNG